MMLANVTHEPMAFAGQGENEPLFLAGVANGATNRCDPATHRRRRNRAAMPHGCGQVGAADDAVAIDDEVLQQIEHLRLKCDEIDTAPQFASIHVE
jgi:hypothetical protein